MTSREIVDLVARKKWLEECIQVVTGGNVKPEHKDLRQDLLLELLDMDSKKLEGLYLRNQLRYFIMRLVRNNIQSKTSRFYYKYRKYNFCNSGPDLLEFVPDEQEET